MDFDQLKHVSTLDDDTFKHIMDVYGQDVWNYVYALTRHKHDSDDIVQDVFLKCHRSIDSFRGQSTFKTWLLTIARNTAINARKSAYWRRIVPMANLLGTSRGDATTRSAEEAAIAKLTEGTIWEKVLSLPDKYREVLVLDAVHGLKQHEIARMLGLSVGGVKSRLFRARARMNEMMKEESPHASATFIEG